MFIKNLLIEAYKTLQNSSPTPNLDSEVLLSFVLGKPREWILTHLGEKISSTDQQKFRKLINKRLGGESVAYLIGHKEFFGLDFLVDKRVPIPRPETEMLVEEVIKNMGSLDNVVQTTPIVEVGTGSGCIAIALAKHLPHTQIIATDISEDALTVARENTRRHGVYKRIRFLQSDLINNRIYESEDANPRHCEYGNALILVANLPYLPEKIYQTAEKSVHLEPKQAHLAGAKGYEIIEKFLKQARALKPQAIFLEFHYEYKNELKKIIKKYLPDYKITFKKDLAGKNRIVSIIA